MEAGRPSHAVPLMHSTSLPRTNTPIGKHGPRATVQRAGLAFCGQLVPSACIVCCDLPASLRITAVRGKAELGWETCAWCAQPAFWGGCAVFDLELGVCCLTVTGLSACDVGGLNCIVFQCSSSCVLSGASEVGSSFFDLFNRDIGGRLIVCLITRRILGIDDRCG
jgi:hypothetical protein